MSKNQKAVAIMVAAVAGQVYLSKVAKRQAAVLGVPALTLSLIGVAVTYALA